MKKMIKTKERESKKDVKIGEKKEEVGERREYIGERREGEKERWKEMER